MDDPTKFESRMHQHEQDDLREIRVEKYKGTRYWAVWLGDQLLAVTVYKKGAMAVKQVLDGR